VALEVATLAKNGSENELSLMPASAKSPRKRCVLGEKLALLAGPPCVVLLIFAYGWCGALKMPTLSYAELKDKSPGVILPVLKPSEWPDSALTVANLGHSTLLMNFLGVRVISDPVLFDRVGVELLSWLTIGPRRLVKAPLKPHELGRIDVIVITHAHMDHLDLRSLAALPKDAAVVACVDCSDLIKPLGFADVRELHWGETTVTKGLRITAFGAKHWGRRLPWGKDRGFNSYILEKDDIRMLLACDSAYTRLFRELRPLDLTIAAFSIGAYNPWIANHANPEQVWSMFEDSGAKYLLPIHWGTFRLSAEPRDEPLARLFRAAGAERWRIVLPQIGVAWSMARSSSARIPRDHVVPTSRSP